MDGEGQTHWLQCHAVSSGWHTITSELAFAMNKFASFYCMHMHVRNHSYHFDHKMEGVNMSVYIIQLKIVDCPYVGWMEKVVASAQMLATRLVPRRISFKFGKLLQIWWLLSYKKPPPPQKKVASPNIRTHYANYGLLVNFIFVPFAGTIHGSNRKWWNFMRQRNSTKPKLLSIPTNIK